MGAAEFVALFFLACALSLAFALAFVARVLCWLSVLFCGGFLLSLMVAAVVFLP